MKPTQFLALLALLLTGQKAALGQSQTPSCPSSFSPSLLWPVSATLTGLTGFESNPQFVMGTLGELRPASTSSNGTNLPDHLHRGVDLKSCPPDSDCTSREVFAVKGGLIGPINSLGVNNKTVNVGPFTYAHLESIDPAITGQQGQFVQAGTH